MMFCAMGRNVILLHSGLWLSPFGLDVLFGSLHGREGMVGVGGALPFKIKDTKEFTDRSNSCSTF